MACIYLYVADTTSFPSIGAVDPALTCSGGSAEHGTRQPPGDAHRGDGARSTMTDRGPTATCSPALCAAAPAGAAGS